MLPSVGHRRREKPGYSMQTKFIFVLGVVATGYFLFLRSSSPSSSNEPISKSLLTEPIVWDATLGSRASPDSSRKAVVMVTGGAGFIGSHVIEELISLGFQPVIFDDRSNGHNDNAAAVDFKSDIRGMDQLQRVSPKPDYIIHLAAAISVAESMTEPDKYQRVNVDGSENVLRFALENKVRRVVTASSAAIYGDKAPLPIEEKSGYGGKSPYAETKFGMEVIQKRYWEENGLESVALRFFNVYGPRQDPKSPYSGVISIFMDKSARNKDFLIFGDGEQTRDFIFVKDIARAIITAMITPRVSGFDSFNVCTGKETTIKDLADTVIRVFSSTAKYTHANARDGDIKKSVCNPSKLNNGLGFTASVSVDSGLEILKNWFNEELKKEYSP